jgi:hypothetical protein
MGEEKIRVRMGGSLLFKKEKKKNWLVIDYLSLKRKTIKIKISRYFFSFLLTIGIAN